MRKASIGSISCGTLRTEDLLNNFALELAWLTGPTRTTAETALIAKAGDVAPDSDEARDVLNELHDALDARSPKGCYFGSHEGDGADFGFWTLEELEESERGAN